MADYTRLVATRDDEYEKSGEYARNVTSCAVLTNRTSHLERLADLLRDAGHDPVILRGRMGAKSRAAALARLQPHPGRPPLLVVATGPYAGEGFDCPALDILVLAAPIANKGSLTQHGQATGPASRNIMLM